MIQFREHEERHLSNEIKFMKWNPKFDLIAVAFKSGDVALHRLVDWQKVWVGLLWFLLLICFNLLAF